MTQELQELQDLLDKIIASDDLVARAEEYFRDYHHEWSQGVIAYFQDFLARKKDQIHYEWYRVNQMGMKIASERANSIVADQLDSYFPDQ